jgi:exopolyphosphatase/guanosine-5'-triphosphate,3'-diphosphate pyrophosphatase
MIVVASCLINLVLENYNISSIRVSAYALKEGLMCQKLNS